MLEKNRKTEDENDDIIVEGKRRNVYETAIRNYYKQVCQGAEGYMFLGQYKPQIDTMVREIK